ncbi:MAG: threonylcarbamoyl-AMP synthase [Clostridiales bacterium]|nr:threonylcarbamoyl-AMP synthase [Clostridiales bacterium]
MTKILKATKDNLIKAKELLLNGELVGFPTETVYGLGADGTNKKAVSEIYKVKGRPSDNPLIAHVHKDYDLTKLVKNIRPYALDLIKAYTPGPLTLVFESKGVVVDEATCGLNTLAIRIPLKKEAQELLKLVDIPIVAPSANLSKHVSPVTAEHVYKDFEGKIPLIIDGGKCEGGIESTVLDVTGEVPEILRAGLITKEMIEKVVGVCKVAKHKEGEKAKSPGVMYTHYRPKTNTALFTKEEIQKSIELYEEYIKQGKTPYFMCDEDAKKDLVGKNILYLGKTAEDIASNLYYKLREGEEKADIIIAIEPAYNGGVYEGVLNRLRRACK